MEEIQHVATRYKFLELFKGHEQRARERFVLWGEEEQWERDQEAGEASCSLKSQGSLFFFAFQ